MLGAVGQATKEREVREENQVMEVAYVTEPEASPELVPRVDEK